jgi:hypothetical protein
MPNPVVALQSHFYCDFLTDDVVCNWMIPHRSEVFVPGLTAVG